MESRVPGSGSRPAGRGVRQTRPPREKRVAALVLLAALVLAGSADLTHVVVKGENLTRIARRYGTTPRAIADANKIGNPSLILVGQNLVIPGAIAMVPVASRSPATGVHVVARGENLTRIAARYGTNAATLAQMNGIRNPSLIRAGQRLSVPSPYRPGVEGMIERYSDEFGVERALVKALAWQESGWQQSVVSPAGAVGVMQVLPETADFTARRLLKTPVDLNDTEQNIKAGVRFLAYLMSLTNRDEQLAVAGYFQGLRSVRTQGVSAKTARYIANVMALKKRFS